MGWPEIYDRKSRLLRSKRTAYVSRSNFIASGVIKYLNKCCVTMTWDAKVIIASVCNPPGFVGIDV